MDSEPRHARRQQVPPSEEGHRELGRDHPLEESQKSYHTMLEQQMAAGEEELDRPATALLLSGLAAGLDIGFGPLAMAINFTLTKDVLAKPLQELINANLYAVGFIFVILGRSALFTEHTTLAVQPVLARRSTLSRLFRLWGLVLLANVIGAALFAFFAVQLAPALGVVELSAFGEVAHPIASKPWNVMLGGAIGAGWLMGLLTWLTSAARDTISQIFVIWATTMLIALGKLHHSIAGTVEVLMGVFAGVGASPADYGRFLVWAVIGNAIGGAIFVALLKFGSVEQSHR